MILIAVVTGAEIITKQSYNAFNKTEGEKVQDYAEHIVDCHEPHK